MHIIQSPETIKDITTHAPLWTTPLVTAKTLAAIINPAGTNASTLTKKMPKTKPKPRHNIRNIVANMDSLQQP